MNFKIKLISLMTLAMTFIGCGSEDIQEDQALRRVVYTKTSQSEDTVDRIFSGTVQGATEANISFRVDGNLMIKHAGLGSEVSEGDVLARLDATDYQINYSKARAALAEAQADVTRNAAEFRRYRELFLNDNASKAEYDNSKASYDASLARLAAAREGVNFAELQLSYTELVAPFDGTVSIELADESENLGAGSPVFTLVREESPEVQLFLPESFTNKVALGDEVSIRVDAVSGEVFTGSIKEVGSGITGLGNTFPVKVGIDETSSLVKTGMSAQVTLGLDNPNAGKVLVPLSSITEDGNGNSFLYTLDNLENGEATLVKNNVELGSLVGNEVEVLRGLNKGEKVVTAGVNYVYDGQRVMTTTKN